MPTTAAELRAKIQELAVTTGRARAAVKAFGRWFYEQFVSDTDALVEHASNRLSANLLLRAIWQLSNSWHSGSLSDANAITQLRAL